MIEQLRSLERFLSAFHHLSPRELSPPNPTHPLAHFIAEFSRLRQTAADTKQSIDANQIFLRPESLTDFLQQLRPSIDAATRRGDFVNVWTIAGLQRDETRNARVLSWLLDCDGSHGQGKLIFESLLRRLTNIASATTAPIVSPLPSHIERPYTTRTEIYPDSENRVDIELDGPDFLAFVEVKIDAPEGQDQIKRYVKLARDKAENRPCAVLFLSRDRDQQLSCNDDIVIRATWVDVAMAITDLISESDDLISTLLRQFADHVNQL
jgi:hypothetical protein